MIYDGAALEACVRYLDNANKQPLFEYPRRFNSLQSARV